MKFAYLSVFLLAYTASAAVCDAKNGLGCPSEGSMGCEKNGGHSMRCKKNAANTLVWGYAENCPEKNRHCDCNTGICVANGGPKLRFAREEAEE